MRGLMPSFGLAVALSLLAGVAQALTASGELRCNVKGGFGVIIAGARPLSCTYRRPGMPVEFYTGYSNTIGLDVGATNANVFKFRVAADPARPGALDGDYAGPSLGIAGNAGFAGAVLVSGTGSSLFPIPNTATTAFTGIDLRVGLGQLHLELAGVEASERYRIRRVLREYGLEDYHQ